MAANASCPHSPACFTSQIPSPHPSARCTPTPPIEPPIPFVDRQLEVNEESFADPASITTSDLSLLFKDVVFAQTDDVLGGQGSATLGDYVANFDIGEQNREVESKEQPPRQPSFAGHKKKLADRGMGPAIIERAGSSAGVPICLFPTAYLVD